MKENRVVSQLADHWQQALAFHGQKLFEQAAQHYQEILALMPNHADTLHYYGLMLYEQEKYKDAFSHMKRAIELNPDHPELLSNFLAVILKCEDDFEEELALKCSDRLLTLRPEWIEGLKNVCKVWAKYEQSEKAIKKIEYILSKYPDDIDMNILMGEILFRSADDELAIHFFERALDLDGSQYRVFSKLCTIKKFKTLRPDAENIYQAFLKFEVGSEERTYLGFALGKMYDDVGEYDRAFECYKIANENKPVEDRCDIFRNRYEHIVTDFNDDFVSKFESFGLDSEKPVFILGMPRSGSTLAEQVLSSHALVYAGGETDDVINGFYSEIGFGDYYWLETERNIERSGGESVRKMAQRYLDIVDREAPKCERFINKMPNNLFNIGLIKTMFPEAKIIYTSRDPLDTILSCYFQPFITGNLFSFYLDKLVEYYNIHNDVMRFWLSRYDDIYVLRYDDMVNKPEESARDLIKYLGVSWDDNCLLHHEKNDRIPRTASHWQARQPIYNTSRNRWYNYEKFLKPYIDKVESDVYSNEDYCKPSLSE